MINYPDLKKYIPEYIAFVIMRNTDNVNVPLTLEQVAIAFVREGFATREDVVVRALRIIGFEALKPYVIEGVMPFPQQKVIEQDRLGANESQGIDDISSIISRIIRYGVTGAGIVKAQEQEEEINDYIKEKPLAEQLGLVEEGTAPAADRIVTLDDNSPPYKEAMSALDEVIEAVDNERKNDFEEKEQIQKELQAGKTLLSALRVDPEKIKATLIKTLKWIGIKFAEGAIFGLAMVAVTTIAALIGIST